MKPKLSFESIETLYASMGVESSIPAISNMINVQNKTKSELSEDEGLFVSYGNLPNSYPYRQRSSYKREYQKANVAVAVLENQYIKATFIPSLGGRLWSLIDKATGENLLYTNDVIRGSNLSAKNAWFSGGVEWNVAIIGHTPFTTEQLFVAELVTDEGFPVLRMYEFERIRKITYQMDFWLTEESRFLFCRMRICNDNDSLVPMYWWSNIAVPEYQGGRLVVPANQAFTSDQQGVKKVNTPIVNGTDISKCDTIPKSVDYFFDIKETDVKYISNLNADGYGLIQASTNRLRGRKLFSWGHSTGSDTWQQYLTNKAGRYIEIQAGVEKTQYGCIPMPPNSAWEWIEVYGSMKTDKASGDYDAAIADVTTKLTNEIDFTQLEQMVKSTKHSIAKKPATCLIKGSGYGALENLLRHSCGQAPISAHLDFGDCGKEQSQWCNLLEHGYFDQINPEIPPESFMADAHWFALLEASMQSANAANWYAYYQLGLMYLNQHNVKKAEELLLASIGLTPSCWAYHALAVIAFEQGHSAVAVSYSHKAVSMRKNDLSLAKDCAKILLDCKEYHKLLNLISTFSSEVAQNPRLEMYRAFCLLGIGELEQADEILNRGNGLEVADIREGELSITDLWCMIERQKNPSAPNVMDYIPQKFNFKAN